MNKFNTMMTMIRRVEREREVSLELYCEHISPNPNHKEYTTNIDGKKVCSDYCDHSNACMGIFRWNGLTYCSECCKHNFGHKNFIEHLDDGWDMCTLCWVVVGQHISVGYNPYLRPKTKSVIPRITVTKCDGRPGRVIIRVR